MSLGPVTCPTVAEFRFDKTKSGCGETVTVPPGGTTKTVYIVNITGGPMPVEDASKLVYVDKPSLAVLKSYSCGGLLSPTTCSFTFAINAPQASTSLTFTTFAGGDSCTIYLAPAAAPTPSPTPSPTPAPTPSPTAPSCPKYLPPPCNYDGYICYQQGGVCCCREVNPPTPSCPSGATCMPPILCELEGGTCGTTCSGGGCCCTKQPTPPPQPTPSPTPTRTPSPSPPPTQPTPTLTPTPAPTPTCPAGTVCVSAGLCGGGGTCVQSCPLGCCCAPPSGSDYPTPPPPQPPGRKPGAF
ncbi:MAG: hypothetical protein ACP5I3_09015 [Thermoproteus sp.]